MKFRKKPVVIEAMQLTGSPGETAKVCSWVNDSGYPWLIGNALDPSTLRYEYDPDTVPSKGIWIEPENGALMIRTLEGDMEATYGDWIIQGVNGEFYPCKPDIFEKTYEPVC